VKEGPPDSRLFELMNLNLSGYEGKDGDVIGLVVLHAHRIGWLALLGLLLAPVVDDVLDVELIHLHPLPLLLDHLIPDLEQVRLLLLFFFLQVQLLLFLLLVLFVLALSFLLLG
jgi:hypothetical protein